MTTLHDLFPGRYLVGEDLDGQDAVVTIRRVEVEEMGRLDKKGETTQKPVVYFNGLDKGLVLNKTNALTIAKMYGDVIEKWYGQAVALYPKREHAFGSDWTVIRIRPRRPEPPAAAVNRETGEIAPSYDPSIPIPELTTRTELDARWLYLLGRAVDLGVTEAELGMSIKPGAKLPPTWTMDVVRRGVTKLDGLVRTKMQAAAVPAYEGDAEPEQSF